MPGQSDLVINTGPVLALAAAGHLQILRELFATVTVPYEVVQEIEAGGRTHFAREEFRAASWLDKRSGAFLYHHCFSPPWIRGKQMLSRSQRLNESQPSQSTRLSAAYRAIARAERDGITRHSHPSQAERSRSQSADCNCGHAPTRDLVERGAGKGNVCALLASRSVTFNPYARSRWQFR